MPTVLTANIDVVTSWAFTEALDLSTAQDNGARNMPTSLSSGTGANAVNLIWKDNRTLAGGASETLDLTALADSILGGSVNRNFALIKAIIIKNNGTATGVKLVIGGAATNEFILPFNGLVAGKVEVGAGTIPLILPSPVDGWAVTGTTKSLKIANPSGTSVTYDIIILGNS